MGHIGECILKALIENQGPEQYTKVVHCAAGAAWKQVLEKSSRHEREQLGF
jgi:hypothetical protein